MLLFLICSLQFYSILTDLKEKGGEGGKINKDIQLGKYLISKYIGCVCVYTVYTVYAVIVCTELNEEL